jgi:hypothetical protein
MQLRTLKIKMGAQHFKKMMAVLRHKTTQIAQQLARKEAIDRL